MARKGRPVSGWLIVDKPAGVGSTQVVGRVRWALDAQKAGHAGTLDPDATGLLAVALGEATKTIPYIAEARKAYDFTVAWGAETSTDDAAGEVLATSDDRPGAAAVEAALTGFRGDILQVPPAVSAVKVDGERAYDLARAGEVVELAARPLHVAELALVAHRGDRSDLRMVCGKGGYVRAIARDVGRALGCLGHVATLRRIWSGPFTLDGAIRWDEIEALARTPALDARLLPLETALAGLPRCEAPEASVARLRQGGAAPVHAMDDLRWGEEAWAARHGRAVAIGTFQGGQLQPSRVFAA